MELKKGGRGDVAAESPQWPLGANSVIKNELFVAKMKLKSGYMEENVPSAARERPALFVTFRGSDRQLSKLMAGPINCFIY